MARVLLAFDLKQPSSCHQTYKLFDELHAAISGRPDVNADRLVFVSDLYSVVVDLLDTMQNELIGKYNLTRYAIIYLIREALETDPIGRDLCLNPSKFMKGAMRQRVREAVKQVATCVVKMLDTEVTRRVKDETEYFDYKSDFKSPKRISELRAIIIGQYTIVVGNNYAPSFSDVWNAPDEEKKIKPRRTK